MLLSNRIIILHSERKSSTPIIIGLCDICDADIWNYIYHILGLHIIYLFEGYSQKNATNLSHLKEDWLESVSEMPVRDGSEDANHGGIIKLINGYDLKVPQKPTSHVVTTSARWSHCSHEQLHNMNKPAVYDFNNNKMPRYR